MTTTEVAALADGLSKAQREAWIWTVLAVVESRPNRRAFADGYNGNACEAPRTGRKLQWHARGVAVAAHLLASGGTMAIGQPSCSEIAGRLQHD